MKKIIREGITEYGTPDMKYYAFDWDDNIVQMPTKIILKDDNGDEVLMATDDFAKYRSLIGKENFEYNGSTVVGFGKDPFKNFSVKGDKQFIVDCMLAKPGPAWDDFMECVNGGSVFAIITARGHNPNVMKEAVYNYIVSGWNGISSDELVKNLKKYRKFIGETDNERTNKMTLIKGYLDLCKFYPVSYMNEEGAKNPEEAKVKSMKEYRRYILELAQEIGKKGAEFIVKMIGKSPIDFKLPKPTIGFSDDDPKNVEVMKKRIGSEEGDDDIPVNIYSTHGGKKIRVK